MKERRLWTRIGLLLGVALPLAAGSALAKAPLQEVLGIFPGMPEEEAHRRLERFGTKNPEGGEAREEEEGGREIWTLKHPRLTYVVMTVDRDRRVDYVQGFLRKENKVFRYGDIGDLKGAKQLGYYIYVWNLPARGDRPALEIQARGSDPKFPGSYFVTTRSKASKTAEHGEERGSDQPTGRGGP